MCHSEKVALLSFNRREEDILLRQRLSDLEKEAEGRLRVVHVLSEASDEWRGEKGRVSELVLRDAVKTLCVGTQLLPVDVFVAVCGPQPFMEAARSQLAAIGYRPQHVHYFDG